MDSSSRAISKCPVTSSTIYRPKGAVTKQIMELPRNKSGDVDWSTLGNMLVAHELGEVVCASYVDRLYGIENPGFKAETDWRFFYKEKDVVVLKKQFEDSPIHCYMGRSVVDVPAKLILDFLLANENAAHFDRYCVESRSIKRFRDEEDIKDCISYLRHDSKQCLIKAKRDLVFYARSEVMNDGKCVLSCLSIDYPDCPVVPGVTRAQLQPGSGWVLEPYQGNPDKTLVSFLVHVDLVSLPPLITNRVMRRVPLNLHHLKEYLLAHPPTTHSHITPPSHLTTDGLPELPTSPQIPTPTANTETYDNLSSLPMESNPLYQSTNLFLSSTRQRTETQESWKHRGVENERLLETGTQRQVSTVPEEEEEEGDCPEIEGLTAKSEVEVKPDTSFQAPFEMTGCESLVKDCSEEPTSQDQWLFVPETLSSAFSGGHSSSPDKRVAAEKVADTPEVSPGNSQGNEWTVASSNNE